jgi:hypothetical protein
MEDDTSAKSIDLASNRSGHSTSESSENASTDGSKTSGIPVETTEVDLENFEPV